MPSAAPLCSTSTAIRLTGLGGQLRQHRKALRISAAAAAEAAGLSRVTLHRIERGEASVTMGAWLNVLEALGLTLEVRQVEPTATAPSPAATASTAAPAAAARAVSVTSRKKAPAMTIPIAVRVDVAIADFPQLQRLAWPLATATVLTAEEALSLYERNWRHVDMAAMEPHERALLDRLVARVGKGQLLV